MFVVVYFAAAAVLALWIDLRFPQLAPKSFRNRLVAVVVATLILPLAPFDPSSRAALLTTLILLVLPALVFAFLTALWLIRGTRDLTAQYR